MRVSKRRRREEEEDGGKGERKSREGKRGVEKQLMFWNVAKLGRQRVDFWRFVQQWDYVSLIETWVEKRGWEKLKGKLPNTHSWSCCRVKRSRKRGRAKRRFLIGVKKDWCKHSRVDTIEVNDGIMVTRIKKDEESTGEVIISVYNNEEWAYMADRMQRLVEEYKKERIIIGDDCNARIGGEIVAEEVEGRVIRKSKNTVINARGRLLLSLVSDIGGHILNGMVNGNDEGEYTCVNVRGSSVIDYVIVNEWMHQCVVSFCVVENVDSDHLPLAATIRQEMEEGAEEEERQPARRQERKEFICWGPEEVASYRESTDTEEWEQVPVSRTEVEEVERNRTEVCGDKSDYNTSKKIRFQEMVASRLYEKEDA